MHLQPSLLQYIVHQPVNKQGKINSSCWEYWRRATFRLG